MVLHLAARLDSIRLPPVRFDRHFSYLICSVTHTYRSRLRESIRRRGFVVPAILNPVRESHLPYNSTYSQQEAEMGLCRQI